jgi:hypothetical protein
LGIKVLTDARHATEMDHAGGQSGGLTSGMVNGAELPGPSETAGAARRSFARDVGVSVTSNLITASVIYIVGAVAHVFPHNALALWSAALILAATASYFGVIITRSRVLQAGYGILGGVVCAVFPFTPVAARIIGAPPGSRTFTDTLAAPINGVLLGLTLIVFSIVWAARRPRSPRENQNSAT